MQLLPLVLGFLADDSTAAANSAMAAMAGASIVSIIIGLAVGIFVLYLWSRIFSKAGFSPWLCLLLIIPLVNIIMIIWFAFAEWPVSRGARV
ncbi:MAG TPA: hypothetical protein VN934_03055 [Candidatus Tumulicola sp.]|jgi:uncharacterized membrane protein YhaH (DUF805 family)|nr:hypothetical protein [Candidatus Tumulicola sp.]